MLYGTKKLFKGLFWSRFQYLVTTIFAFDLIIYKLYLNESWMLKSIEIHQEKPKYLQ